MESELLKSLRSIRIENLNEDDKSELLRLFMITKNAGIRNFIALTLSELGYNKAIPYIIKKINDKSISNYTGTLVYSLENLDSKRYFLSFIKVICENGYEARLMAYEIIKKYVDTIPKGVKEKALKILNNFQTLERPLANDNYMNSRLHFIESTIDLLNDR